MGSPDRKFNTVAFGGSCKVMVPNRQWDSIGWLAQRIETAALISSAVKGSNGCAKAEGAEVFRSDGWQDLELRLEGMGSWLEPTGAEAEVTEVVRGCRESKDG